MQTAHHLEWKDTSFSEKQEDCRVAALLSNLEAIDIP